MVEKKDELKELKKKLGDAKEYGLNVQKSGQKIVSAAEYNLDFADFIENKEALRGKAEIRAWIAGANATIPAQPPANLQQINNYYLAINTSSTSASTIFMQQASPLEHIQEISIDGTTSITFPHKYVFDSDALDQLLRDFEKEFNGIGDLVSMRNGAWEVFNSGIRTDLLMASHSIRLILDKVISKGAKNEDMKALEDWDTVEKAGEESKQRSRLKYLIYGSYGVEDNSLENVSSVVEKCYKAHKRLKGIAHGSTAEREETQRAMEITESALLVILSTRKLKKNK